MNLKRFVEIFKLIIDMAMVKLIVVLLLVAAANCNRKFGDLIVGSWTFPRYTEVAGLYIPSARHSSVVSIADGWDFYFTYTVKLCNGTEWTSSNVGIRPPNSRLYKWLTMGYDGLPDRPVCSFSELQFSATGRVGKSTSNCFYKDFCFIKSGAPLEGLEDELNALCPLTHYKVAPLECDADSEESDK